MPKNPDGNSEYLALVRIKMNDEKAFEFIFNKYFSQVYRFISSILFDDFLAEDITQSVFLTIWENRENLDPDKNFNNYIFTIAKNKVYRHIERLILKNKHELYLVQNSTSYIDLNDEINKQFLENLLIEIINELPTQRKKIFTLSRFENLSNKEIATLLSVSEKTVSTQISRSLLFIKEKMNRFLTLFLF